MRVAVSRASVSAGDDIESHDGLFEFPDDAEPSHLIRRIAKSGWLAPIVGGRATWSVRSNAMVAVVAQEWREPKMYLAGRHDLGRLDWRDGDLHLHFNYHAQIDPETVFRTLWGFRFRS